MSAHLSILVVISSVLGGCVGGYRIGVGPTLDTNLDVGATVSVSGYFGVGEDDGLAFAPVVDLGAGARFNEAAPRLEYAVGWDVIAVVDEDVALRIGPRLHARWTFQDGNGAVLLAGPVLAAAGSFGPMRDYHLGIELRGGVLFADGFESNARGSFSLTLVYDRIATWDAFEVWN